MTNAKPPFDDITAPAIDPTADRDETDFVQRCIDAGEPIPAGQYLISRTLTIPRDVKVHAVESTRASEPCR